MSWSCDARAGARLDFINSLIAAQGNKMQNEWTTKRGTYFYERGKEQRDGSIVGQIHRNTTPGMCKRSGRFRIEPNGKVSAGPAIFQTSCTMVTIYSNAAGSIPFRAPYTGVYPPTQESVETFLNDWVRQCKTANPHLEPIYPNQAVVNDVDSGASLLIWIQPSFYVWAS